MSEIPTVKKPAPPAIKKLMKVKAACAVCALQYVSQVDEEAVLRICALHGFKTGQGMHDKDWRAAAATLEIKSRGVSMTQRSLGQFLKDYPTGLFFVATHDHLFVVDHGRIIDPRNKKPPGLKRMLRQAWRVTKIKPVVQKTP